MYTTGGKWVHRGELWTDWCGGFLAGMMWLFHQASGDAWWREQAEYYSRLLEARKSDRHVHDLGFIFLNSFRRWHAATGEDRLMNVLAEAGVTLAGRFQERGQYLASFLGPSSLFIDIMMNVPLLFVAADWIERRRTAVSGLEFMGMTLSSAEQAACELRRRARSHCDTSRRHLVRPDGSTAHEAIFDTDTGQFLRESTQQGLRPDSCWSRGLAWSLYGFSTVYQLTGDMGFLETACRCADYFLAHLPAGRVPYWDFAVSPGSDQPWDSSAAAIAASGLLELVRIMDGGGRSAGLASEGWERRADAYREGALEMLDVLSSDEFLARNNPQWEGILRHAVYHIHKRLGVDESVMWGDHFFVEALHKACSHSARGCFL
jgi:unsaturated chondroitin disaccharide hydrolase